MRALVVVVLAVALAAVPALAQSSGGTRLEVRAAGYADDDATYVLRPYVAGRLAVGSARVGASYSPDVVSTASVDVLASASRVVEEVRHQAVADVAHVEDGAVELGASYSVGLEPDHETHGGQLRAQADLDPERMWHGGVIVGVTWARIGSVLDPRMREEATTLQGSAALAQILDASTVARLSLEGSVTSGFQSSPYRNVRLGAWTASRGDAGDPESPAWIFAGVTGAVRERHPELRVRARLGLEAVRDLGGGVALLGRIAGYADDWGMLAGDVSAELRVEPEQALVVRVGGRAYVQSAVSFWRQRYDGVNESDLVTGDRELGPMRTYALMVAVSIPVDALILGARLEGMRFEYPEFDLLPERHAVSLMLGVTWSPDLSL